MTCIGPKPLSLQILNNAVLLTAWHIITPPIDSCRPLSTASCVQFPVCDGCQFMARVGQCHLHWSVTRWCLGRLCLSPRLLVCLSVCFPVSISQFQTTRLSFRLVRLAAAPWKTKLVLGGRRRSSKWQDSQQVARECKGRDFISRASWSWNTLCLRKNVTLLLLWHLYQMPSDFANVWRKHTRENLKPTQPTTSCYMAHVPDVRSKN